MPSVIFENRSTWPHREVEIYVDGYYAGRVQRHDRFEIIVDPGVHTFSIRADHKVYSSPIRVHLEKRESAGFLCAVAGVFEKRVELALVFHHRPHDRFDEHDLVKSLAVEAAQSEAPPQAHGDE